MKNKIDYYDSNLANLIKQKLGNKYGSFQPIVIDVLLRRKYVFKYSNEQCLKETDRFIDNCEYISFKKMDDARGKAYPTLRKIEIDKSDNISSLYGTIAHEMSHILSYHFIEHNKKGERVEHNISKENLKKFERKLNLATGARTLDTDYKQVSIYGTAIMESLIEASSAILYKKRTSVYKSNIEEGYSIISELIPRLLSAGVGVSDLDIIVSGVHSENELTQTLARNFKNHDLSLAQQDIELLNDAASMMHKILYTNRQRFLNVFLTKNDTHLMKSAIKEAGVAAYRLACHQIESDDRPISDELILELTTRYEKINQSIEQCEKNLSEYSLIPSKKNIFPEVIYLKQMMMNKIYGMYLVNLYKKNIKSIDSLKTITELAKQGKINELEIFLGNHISIKKEIIYKAKKNFLLNLRKMEKNKANPYLKKLEHDDLLDDKQWDNKSIFKVLKRVSKPKLKKELTITPNINDIVLTILPYSTTNRYYGIQALEYAKNHTFKSRPLTEHARERVDAGVTFQKEFEEKMALGNEYRYTQDTNYKNKLDENAKSSIALTFARIHVEAFDVLDELFYDDCGYAINNSVETNKSRLFTSHIGFEKTLRKYNNDAKELYRLKYINQSDYKLLKDHKYVKEVTKRLDNRMLLSFIKIELGDKLDSHTLFILNEAIYNGDFEETFNRIVKTLGISRNIESYKNQFILEQKVFQLKDGAKKLFSKFIFNKNKALPDGSNDSKTSIQSAKTSFIKRTKIENIIQPEKSTAHTNDHINKEEDR